jgi:hypothetical protein
MAIQRSSRTLGSPNPLATTLEVNDETGEASLYTEGLLFGRTLIATSDNVGNEWVVNNRFRQTWNSKNNLNLNAAEFNDEFNTNADLRKILNNDRASLINKHSSDAVKKSLKDAGVPGVKDPVTGATPKDTTETPTTASDSDGSGGDTNTSTPADTSNTDIKPKILKGTDAGMPGGQLRYPIDMTSEMNKLKINIREYSPKGVAGKSGSFETPARQKGSILTSIILPIPGGISDNNQVSWGKGDMNALEQAAAELAIGGITQGVDGVKKAATNIAGRIGNNIGGTKAAVANVLAGGAAGIGAQLMQRNAGAIINPNAELLFNGPSLRQFGFSINLSARSNQESKMITLIIRALKQGMSVRRSQSGLFLLSPHLFELSYVTSGDNKNPFLNKFKMCAMTGLNVNYTPNQTFMTLENDMPVSYRLDMQFSELEPIFNDDYGNDTSIGY